MESEIKDLLEAISRSNKPDKLYERLEANIEFKPCFKSLSILLHELKRLQATYKNVQVRDVLYDCICKLLDKYLNTIEKSEENTIDFNKNDFGNYLVELTIYLLKLIEKKSFSLISRKISFIKLFSTILR